MNFFFFQYFSDSSLLLHAVVCSLSVSPTKKKKFRKLDRDFVNVVYGLRLSKKRGRGLLTSMLCAAKGNIT